MFIPFGGPQLKARLKIFMLGHSFLESCFVIIYFAKCNLINHNFFKLLNFGFIFNSELASEVYKPELINKVKVISYHSSVIEDV